MGMKFFFGNLDENESMLKIKCRIIIFIIYIIWVLVCIVCFNKNCLFLLVKFILVSDIK